MTVQLIQLFHLSIACFIFEMGRTLTSSGPHIMLVNKSELRVVSPYQERKLLRQKVIVVMASETNDFERRVCVLPVLLLLACCLQNFTKSHELTNHRRTRCGAGPPAPTGRTCLPRDDAV
jgi:hypothetical protein